MFKRGFSVHKESSELLLEAFTTELYGMQSDFLLFTTQYIGQVLMNLDSIR